MAISYSDLFVWYVIVITWSIAFIIAASLYLYFQSRKYRKGEWKVHIRNFAVVWVLIALLCLYVVAINMSSYVLFAIGNVVVEIYLFYYITKNKASRQEDIKTLDTVQT